MFFPKEETNLKYILILTGFGVMVGAGIVFFSGRGFPSFEDISFPEPSRGPEEEESGFQTAGNLSVNNPGHKRDTFYLVYEKPGSPALEKELVFDQESVCVREEEFNCLSSLAVLDNRNELELWSGERVELKGVEEDGRVVVKRMDFLEKKNRREVEEIAREWILLNSPTYIFDGRNLSLIETRALDLEGCEECYEVEFSFESTHAGYGDREGQMLAQVITPHNIVIRMEEGSVTKAVTDQKYDEINEEFIGS